jgi:recombinational DNA repair protein (RecF pathway)
MIKYYICIMGKKRQNKKPMSHYIYHKFVFFTQDIIKDPPDYSGSIYTWFLVSAHFVLWFLSSFGLSPCLTICDISFALPQHKV